MWPFDTKRTDFEIANTKLHNEIKDLKQLIDELFSREAEAKGVFHYTVAEKENKIKELESKIAALEDTIDDMKHMGKRVKKPKDE
jgi:peptidoglycan hydrolase CwlO-like protein